MNKPHFIVKAYLQKTAVTGVKFSDVVTPEVLADVCYRITGTREFTYDYVDNSYSDDFLEPTYKVLQSVRKGFPPCSLMKSATTLA